RRPCLRPSSVGAPAATLAVEPRVEIGFAEAPLPPDADGGNPARLDQAVDGAQVDLQVLEDLFGREKRLVDHVAARSILCRLHFAGTAMRKRRRAPPWLSESLVP